MTTPARDLSKAMTSGNNVVGTVALERRKRVIFIQKNVLNV